MRGLSMIKYYNLDIIPIILNRFKINDIVLVGELDEITFNHIMHYSECNGSEVNINNIAGDNILEALSTLNDYDAIFLNDDPNWFTVFNELKLIKLNNHEFPLVFVCHNRFPHKRRDAYINPDIIPKEFLQKYSKDFSYNNIIISDDYYHAIDENTPKNGVLTAIEDFIHENLSIGVMEINLLNGISILYFKNSISHIRLSKLFDEIEEYSLDFEELQDDRFKNQFLLNYLSNLGISKNTSKIIEDFKVEISKKNHEIRNFEDKILLHGDELSYIDSKLINMQSEVDLKELQIKNINSQIINKNNEIDSLNTEINQKNNEIDSLNTEINQKNSEIDALNIEVTDKNQIISKLKQEINENELNLRNIEIDFDNHINCLSEQLKNKTGECVKLNDKLKNYQNEILVKNKNIKNKNDEINLKENKFNTIKNQYLAQLSELDNNHYCISCFKEEITNKQMEISYLKKRGFVKKIFTPLAYVYLMLKSNPNELILNFKLYFILKNSNCFDVGYYLRNNPDLIGGFWFKYFSLELHYVCNGFNEHRKFNKKYFNRNSKQSLYNYILTCSK